MVQVKRWRIFGAGVAILTIAVLAVAFVGHSASAKMLCSDLADKCTSILPGNWCYGRDGFIGILQLILNIMTMGIGVLATIGLVISGIQWLTARDKEDQIVKSKNRIFNIVIGIAVWGLLWLILGWLVPSFSTDIPALNSFTEKKETCIEVVTAEEIAEAEENWNNAVGLEGDNGGGGEGPGNTGAIDPSFSGYNQFSEPWGSKDYGDCGPDGTYGDAGCGPSAIASIVSAMTGRKVTPDAIGAKAVANGYRICGDGSAQAISNLVKDYGLDLRGSVSKNDIPAMSAHLRNGAMLFVVISANSGLSYAGTGHYIVIRGITDSGKWLVYDSNGNKGQNNFAKEYDPASLTASFKRNADVIYK